MSDDTISHRLSTEGADLLTLAGVNDANLIQLSRMTGAKVSPARRRTDADRHRAVGRAGDVDRPTHDRCRAAAAPRWTPTTSCG